MSEQSKTPLKLPNTQKFGAAFVDRMRTEALNSAAVDHPYLSAIGEGDFPDANFAFRDFAQQYGLYCTKFTDYMSAVIANLSDPAHIHILQNNLAEELGEMHDAELPSDVVSSIRGHSHSQLYQRFERALHVDNTATEDCSPGMLWQREFQALCETGDGVGIGAIGFGTELIVARIYDQILQGLKAHSSLTQSERVFFDLHSSCDEEHAAQLLSIIEDLACDEESCEKIAQGMRAAIELRVNFWNAMLTRANNFCSGNLQQQPGATCIGH